MDFDKKEAINESNEGGLKDRKIFLYREFRKIMTERYGNIVFSCYLCRKSEVNYSK